MPFLRILAFLKNSAHNTYYVTSHIICGYIVLGIFMRINRLSYTIIKKLVTAHIQENSSEITRASV